VRKGNAVVSVGIIGLFLIHGIAGGFQMMGLMPGGQAAMEALAWVMVVLVVVHMVIGLWLTVLTIQISRRAKASYLKENIVFWTRRVSGFAVMLLLFWHFALFVQTKEGVFRLADFGTPQMIGQLLFVLALAVHLLCNIRPLAVALGLYGGKGYGRDVLLIFSVVLAFLALAFVVYNLRWNVFWR
jgi:succinate dehydrogenase/fumarate reductase cytochrome b subunit